MPRILCVWLPDWSITRLWHTRHRQGGALDSADEARPLVLYTERRGQRSLAAVCQRGRALGLRPGQTLTQAMALCPGLVAEPAQPEADDAALAALAQWATRYTPLAAAAPPDALWLDIAGCAHLFGDEATLVRCLLARLGRWRLDARFAIAPTAAAAAALARFAPGTLVGSDQAALTAALAPLPTEALLLPAATTKGLRRLGLRSLGQIADLPRAELAARFDPAVLTRLDQCWGAAPEPMAWPSPPPDWTEQVRLAEPIGHTQACAAVLEQLARRLCARLDARSLGGLQFSAVFHIIDGSARHIPVVTALPVRDPAYLLRLLSARLDGLDPGFGIEAVTLSAPVRDAARPTQPDLMGAGAADQGRLAALIDTLTQRLGPARLWRFAPRASHIPERAMQRAAPLCAIAWPDPPPAPRPLRLLPHPEKIMVTAMLPDDPPVQFRWRGGLHRVHAATGPERIAPEWWREDAATRDYYQVEDTCGARFWLYRAEADWWLHGLFA